MKALDGLPFDVLATEGSLEQATLIAQPVDRARRWVGPILELDPAFRLLGYIYHEQVPFTFPRFWLNELFANLVMIGYLTENEPEQVELVDALLDAGPGSCLWYQMLLVAGAISSWRDGGQRAMAALYEKFREAMDDDCIVNTSQEIHPVASRFVTELPTRGTPPWRH